MEVEKGSVTAPYLSIVVTTRNDDHGGSLLRRTQTFVNCLTGQVKRYGLPVELIVVEWNPPPDRSPLRDALHWPAGMSPCEVRLIEVPAAIHAQYKNGHALPLYQMIAKNAGIRRARGEFVLATNIDILFSDALMEFIAARRLEPGRMYRIDRYDVAADVPMEAAVEEQLAYCETHVIRVNARGGTFPVPPEEPRQPATVDAHPEGGVPSCGPPVRRPGFFGKIAGVLRRAAENGSHVTVTVPFPRLVGSALRTGLRMPKPPARQLEPEPECVPTVILETAPARLHTNACGDFTLMARSHWLDLRGYPEWDLYSFHIDSVLCYAAHYGGAREVLLEDPMRIYHIEHGQGSGWTPEGEALLFRRLQEKGIPWLEYEELMRWAAQMQRLECPMIFNLPGWGLSGHELPETALL